MRRRVARKTRGFTLIELMLVVAVVGILSALAVVGYGRYVRSSKMNEATFMINAIRTAQEHYYSDQLQYLDVSNSLDASYPAAIPGQFKTQWGAACANCNHPWTQLGIDAPGPVTFGYAVVAGSDVCDPACRGATLPTGLPTAPFKGQHWYAAKARADTNGNGVFWEVYAVSTSPNLLVINEGE